MDRSVAASATSAATASTTRASAATTSATSTVTAFSALLGLLVGLLLEPLGVAGVVGLHGESLGPKVGGQVLISLGQSLVGRLQEILSSSGMTRSIGVTILDTSESKHLLGDGSTDNTGTSGGGDELDTDGSALAGDLTWDGMDVTDLVTQIAATDGDEAELGVNESALDGDLDFLGDLDAKTDVASHVTDGNDGLEAGALTGLGLLLDGDDLHHIVLELVLGTLDELVNDLGLLDRDGVSVDFLKGLDVVGLNQSSELSLRDPFILGGTATATWASTSSTATTTAESTAAITATITTAIASAFASAFSSGLSFHCKCAFVFNND